MERVTHAAQETVEVTDGVHLTQLVVGEAMSVQHFHVEPGASVPEHSHPQEQVGYLTRGTLTFEVGETGDPLEVQDGDSYALPPETVHAATNEGEEPAVGVDVFAPPRPNPSWQE